jgi:glutamate carboxypeptidase
MTALLASLRGRLPAMLGMLEALVAAESPSDDVAATRRCAAVVGAACRDLLGAEPDTIDLGGRPHLRLCWGEPRVLLLGHFDTVWPLGAAAVRPFGVRDGIATGPGVFDMKAGIVQGLFALAAVPGLDGVELLLTSDEELGAPTSRVLIEEAARSVAAVLVLEPSAAGALKVARKGSAAYRVIVHGRAAHAGLEPERGVNALVEMATHVLAVAALADPDAGTTVTPAVAAAGTTANTVPDRAQFTVDARAWTSQELERVDAAVRALAPVATGAALAVVGGIDRPPLERSASDALFERAQALATALGIPPLRGADVGGGSDGNLTAALGVPTLDGLGAVGAGAHADDERVEVDAMPERAALVAALVAELTSR